MNGKHAIIRLKLALNKLDTASNRTVRPEQALLFLNDAYEKLTEAKYSKNLNNEDRTGFQFNQLSTDELNHLTKIKESTPELSIDEYSVSIEEIEGYRYHLRTEFLVRVGTVTKWVKNPAYKTLDTLGTADGDPFNKTEAYAPITFFEDNKIKALKGDFEILKFKTVYMAFPDKITLEDEIKAPFVQKIIDTAAALILENWGDPRTQSTISVKKVIENE